MQTIPLKDNLSEAMAVEAVAAINETSDNNLQDEKASSLVGLPKLLRTLGAISLFAAAVAFMLTEWTDLDSLYRYISFLGFSVVLTAGGVFSILHLKDSKGARTFLGVAAAIIPAHFAQLGALIYAQYLGQSAAVPALFKFAPLGFALTLGTVAVATTILAFIAYGGFSVMARRQALPITAVYMVANATLLIPIRGVQLVGILSLALLSAVLVFDFRRLRGDHTLETFEGRSVRAMLYAPYAILVGRTFLYGSDLVTLSLVVASVGGLSFLASGEAGKNREADNSLWQSLQVLGGIMLTMGALLFLRESFYLPLASYIGTASAAMIILIAFAYISRQLAVYSICSGAFYRGYGALISTVTGVLALCVGGSVIASMFLAVLGVAHIIYGYTDKEKLVFSMGLFGFAAALIHNLGYATELFAFSPWMALAAIGVLVVIGSSYIEQRLGGIVARVSAFRSEVNTWA